MISIILPNLRAANTFCLTRRGWAYVREIVEDIILCYPDLLLLDIANLLFAVQYRSVGVIIVAHGYDERAYWAVEGCSREMTILLNTEDLITMNKVKLDLEDPSTYLLDKLDEVLSGLEK